MIISEWKNTISKSTIYLPVITWKTRSSSPCYSVKRRPLSSETRLHSSRSSSGFCGGKSYTEADFYRSNSIYPMSIIIILPMIYNIFTVSEGWDRSDQQSFCHELDPQLVLYLWPTAWLTYTVELGPYPPPPVSSAVCCQEHCMELKIPYNTFR
jgi:hypothetical protein